jgi:hypothetical protein
MKIGIVGMAALGLASCGGSAKQAMAPGAPSSPAAMAPGGAPAVATASAPAAAKIATDGDVRHAPPPGQLTAGVWDDNLNFEFFTRYASRIARSSQDLSAFAFDEQRASRDLFGRASSPRNELDVQLVLDTTGSMGDELAYLQSEFDSIAKQVRTRFPNLTPRWSLVLYKDRGDAYVTRPFDFTSDPARFQRDLAAQSAGGGGDFPEAVIPALDHGLAQGWRRDDSVSKIIFWVADAPPHHGEGSQLAALARKARDMGVRIYPIASSGIDDATEYQMRATAQLTGGRYVFLTDDSQVGHGHAEPHIPCYAVTRLDHAVVRMIDTELSGRRAAAVQDQVLRRVGNPNSDGTCTVHELQVVAF